MNPEDSLHIWDADKRAYVGKKEYLSKNIQEYIDTTVARAFSIPVNMLFVRRRLGTLVGPRYIAMLMSMKYLKLSASYVANYYGMYKHSIVNHARRTIDNKVDTDRMFAHKVSAIDANIRSHISLFK